MENTYSFSARTFSSTTARAVKLTLFWSIRVRSASAMSLSVHPLPGAPSSAELRIGIVMPTWDFGGTETVRDGTGAIPKLQSDTLTMYLCGCEEGNEV